MIRVTRSGEPAAFTSKGRYQVARPFLFVDQLRKCAYCERFPEVEFQDVDHFRPKRIYPWLRMEWTNLLFACQQCNRRFKRAHFDLIDEAERLVADTPPPGSERPKFIDPADPLDVDPVAHIRFAPMDRQGAWWPIARRQSPRGSYCCRHLGLRRPGLIDQYRRRAELVEAAVTEFEHATTGTELAKRRAWKHVTRFARPEQEFSALAWDIIDRRIPPSRRDAYGVRLDRPGC